MRVNVTIIMRSERQEQTLYTGRVQYPDVLKNCLHDAIEKWLRLLDSSPDRAQEPSTLEDIELCVDDTIASEIVITEDSRDASVDNHSGDEQRLLRAVSEQITLEGNADCSEGTGEEAMASEPERSQESSDVYVLIRHGALECARQHANEDKPLETGGVLLGQFLKARDGGTTVLITGIVRAREAVRRETSLDFTSQAWAGIWRHIDADPVYGQGDRWSVVGWYHSHPNFGIFLSNMDLDIHHDHFAQHGHVALVVDPVRNTQGFFCWDRDHKEVVLAPEEKCRPLTDSEMLVWLEQYSSQALASLPPPEIGFTRRRATGTVPETTADSASREPSVEDEATATGQVKTPEAGRAEERDTPDLEPRRSSRVRDRGSRRVLGTEADEEESGADKSSAPGSAPSKDEAASEDACPTADIQADSTQTRQDDIGVDSGDGQEGEEPVPSAGVPVGSVGVREVSALAQSGTTQCSEACRPDSAARADSVPARDADVGEDPAAQGMDGGGSAMGGAIEGESSDVQRESQARRASGASEDEGEKDDEGLVRRIWTKISDRL